MRATGAATDLARGVLAGEVGAIARMITRVERGAPDTAEQMAQLYRAGGRARVIGVTGPAGAGKSTLVAALGAEIRRRDLTLGIVAIDPTSPYSGGSVLGDRIRMQALGDDPEVFIRSMATRGALGGIARATADAVAVLDASGKDVILVETVGVGQDEVDIAQASHSVVVVSAPGLGDDVQALKAGLLETADVHVVNKADREGADRTVAELRSMLGFEAGGGWVVPVVPTCAVTDQGMTELADALNEHHNWLVASGGMHDRQRVMARHRLKTLLTALVHERLDRPVPGSAFEAAVEALCLRTTDPWTAAHSLLERELSGRPKGRS